MQDKALIYIAKAVKAWFKKQGIPVKDWPPYSLDINLIKYTWFLLKIYVLDHYPKLLDMGASKDAVIALAKALVEA
jgi:hypothetical protein